MHSNQCPGPDGYNSGFYLHFWMAFINTSGFLVVKTSCSEDIFKDCSVLLDTGRFLTSLNSSNIALNPNGDS